MRFQRFLGIFSLIIGVSNNTKRKEIKKTSIGISVNGSGSITSVGEERANLSAAVYL